MAERWHVARHEAVTVECPKCGAGRGEPCARNNGNARISCHRARGDAYLSTVPTGDEAREKRDAKA
jgi:hypothetical protein